MQIKVTPATNRRVWYWAIVDVARCYERGHASTREEAEAAGQAALDRRLYRRPGLTWVGR